MRRVAHLFAVLAASAGLGACSGTAESVGCPAGTLLTAAGCAPICAASEECLLGETCVDGACVPGNAGPTDAGGHPDAISFPDAAVFRDASEPLDLGMMACVRDEDCGPRDDGEWSECVDFAEPCGETGKKFRTVSMPFCDQNNMCGVRSRMEMDSCTRKSRAGNECAPSEAGEFGPCFNPNECAYAGMQLREVTIHKCEAEECRPIVIEEHQECPREPENMPCGLVEEILPPGPCLPAMECATDGNQTFATNYYACREEACVVVHTETVEASCPLMVPTDGAPCGMDGAGHCCNGSCYGRDSDEHCGVCFVSCESNRSCEQINADPSNRRYACSCRDDNECIDSGPLAYCSGDFITPGSCSCDCGSAMSPCTGQCPIGRCYMNGPFGTCRYP